MSKLNTKSKTKSETKTIKVKELKAKIKEIKPEKKEESLEAELEQAEDSSFSDFISSPSARPNFNVPGEEFSRQGREETEKYVERRESKAPEETPQHMRYENTNYTPAEKASRINPTISPSTFGRVSGERGVQVRDIDRFREEHQREQQREEYTVEAQDMKIKRKMPWER